MIRRITLVLSLSVLLSGCGIYISTAPPPQGANQTTPITPTPQSSTTNTPQTSQNQIAQQSGSNEESLSLSVQVLPVRVNGANAPLPSYPASVNATIPTAWAGDLAAYGIARMVVIAPKNWSGYSDFGADGNSGGVMSSMPSSPIQGTLTYTEASNNPAYAEAVKYFPSLWPSAKKDGYVFGQQPSPPPNETFLSDERVAYSFSDQINGVAETTLIKGGSKLPIPWFQKEEVSLPSQDHGLATVILNFFISQTPGY